MVQCDRIVIGLTAGASPHAPANPSTGQPANTGAPYRKGTHNMKKRTPKLVQPEVSGS
jgi:hypothetical protein